MKKYILISFLFLFLIQSIQSQNREIYGRVTDNEENVLPGVSVLLEGTTIATMTENDGTFRISFKDFKKSVLIFSFIGMKTKEVELKDTMSLPIIVKLEPDDNNMKKVYLSCPLNSLYLAVGLASYNLAFDNFSEFSEKEIEIFNRQDISDIYIGISGYKNNIYSGLLLGFGSGFFIEDSLKTSVMNNRYTVPIGYGFHSKNHSVIMTPLLSVSRNCYHFVTYNENEKITLSNYLQTKYINLKFIQYTSTIGGNLDIRLFKFNDYGRYYPFYLSLGAAYFFKLSKFPKIKSPNNIITTPETINAGNLFLNVGIKLYLFDL